MNFWADTPYVTAYVRNEFLYDQQGAPLVRICNIRLTATYPHMELPVYRMTVDEVDEGVQFVALVDMPAIEKPFQAFAKTPQRFAETGERRVLTGPLMLADTPIYRKDDTYGEYYVVFDKATIRKIVQKYFKQGNQHNVNAYHNAELDGVFMFESYITDTERGVLAPKGYEDTPDGSWFGFCAK